MRGQATLTKDEAEKLVQSACAAMATELDRLRAALAEAERERDEAVSKIREHAEHVNYYGALYSQTELERRNIDEQREFYKDELAKAQTCADEMAALAWKWKYKADCQRATIRALVVAARAIHRTLWSALDQYDVNNEGIEREMRQHVIGLRWEMQQSERGQAGKE